MNETIGIIPRAFRRRGVWVAFVDQLPMFVAPITLEER